MVRPVPPDDVGSAVPERAIANVPDAVIGVPVTERNAGTVAATALVYVDVVRVVDVTRATFPVPVDPSHDATVPFEKRSVLAPPIVVRPVPL